MESAHEHSTAQRGKLHGGLAVPNFKLYFWSFILRLSATWFDPQAEVSWRALEEKIVAPCSLRDILFSNISINHCQLRFDPILSLLIETWQAVEKFCNFSCRWHLHSPIFNNKGLLIRGRPISLGQWENRGVRLLGDIFDKDGLCSFQDIKEIYSLPGTSFFFYLQLRPALKAYGGPWHHPVPIHPLHELITTRRESEGMASILYQQLLIASHKTLPLYRIWRKDVQDLKPDFNWDTVLKNIKLSSRNPDHQQINLNFIHRTYLTPRKLHLMKTINDASCTLCSLGAVGTFIHMIWECPPVIQFWNVVANMLSDFVNVKIPVSIPVLILNDLSSLCISKLEKCVVLSGLTAAKKMIAVRWKPPHSISKKQWLMTLFDIIHMEIS